MKTSLKEYARKRDFGRTSEPRPKKGRTRSGGRFVVQKHQATRLHYDFRLEIEGTLKSWAVPKGIPYIKGEKRLAVQVEDHPVSYIDFEGTIPKGQYGGGTVMVWDEGMFEILGKQELDRGKLHVRLQGRKLEGEWYLVQMRGGKEWLLVRGGENMKAPSKREDDTSVKTGKSMRQLGGSIAGATPQPDKESARRFQKVRRSPPPEFIRPMQARAVPTLPADGEWIYEIKFDGYRALAFKKKAAVQLLSRNEKDFTTKFASITAAVSKLTATECVLDGEIVALDDQGRSSFQLLQRFELGEESPPLHFYVFDLLRLEGKDIVQLPLEQRKARLKKVLVHAPAPIRYSASLSGPPEALLKNLKRLGLEGLVGKRRASAYAPGSRNGNWIKFKLRPEQEMVIGGYTEPDGSRKHFGALLVGYYAGRKLKYAGKVGTGFDSRQLGDLQQRFASISRNECPFANLPEERNGRHGQAITASQMKRCHWVRPILVAQVRFAEWTAGDKLRQPVFVGLREDKNATEVVREQS